MEDTDELRAVLEDLGRVSKTLDVMWRTAVRDGSDTAVHLGEASHEVHRAIIAMAAERAGG
jgi:hypothetical protein